MRRIMRTLWLAILCGLLLSGPVLAQGPGPTPAVPAVPGAQPPTACRIGQPCAFGGLIFTVNSATATGTVQGLAPLQPGFTYLVLNISIALSGEDQVPYSPNYLVVRTANGFQSSFIPLDGSIAGLGNGTFGLGTNLNTDVAFVVPDNASGLVAIYRPLLPNEGFAELRVDLGT